jgi:hypothetical protein
MLASLHQAAKLQGLDDETYRDMLENLTGKRSAKDLTDEQLSLVLNNFHVKRPALHAHHAKIKALYIAAFNLGAMANGTDAAIDGFVQRQTGKERLTFVTPNEAASIVEALKAILSRNGFVVPDNDEGGLKARRALLEAQWAKLFRLQAVRIGNPSALSQYISRKYLTFAGGSHNLTCAQLDSCARDFGRWIRKAQAGKPESQKAGNAA